jgi:hypothetical protein
MKTLFRNTLHVIIGAFIGLSLYQTFSGVPFVVQLGITAIVLTVIGGFWEWCWQIYNGSEVDNYDILRGVVGGLLVITYYYIFT